MNFIKLKLWFKEKWYYIAIFGIALLAIIFYIVTKKKPSKVVIDKASEELYKKLSNLRIESALEIGRAQGKEQQVKEEVEAITNLPTTTKEEKLKQLQQLADLLNR